jgi:tetratricopeptide (TPR) repeat protein
MKRRCLLTLVLPLHVFVCSAPAFGQAGGLPAKSGANDAPQETAKPPSDFSQEPLVFEYLRTVMRYENDGTGTRETVARIHVQSTAGLTKAGQLIFDYNASNESVEIRSVLVRKPDGAVVAAGADAVQDLSAPVAREAPMYTDARQKHVTVPSLSVGDTVEYDVLTSSKPLLPGEFWHTWVLEETAICLDEQVELNVPRERALKMKGPPGVEATSRDEGDRRIYVWKTSNLKVANPFEKLKNFKFDVKRLLEGMQPAPAQRVEFSTFQSWAEVGNWYADLEKDRRVPSIEVRAKADEIVRGKSSELEKTEALYQWVSRNIRYVSLSFGVGRYQPHAASEVLANRYGDCKDKTTLLQAFLEAEGIHGHAALINSGGNFDADVPTPLQFDHAITFVPISGKDEWLDSTVGVLPFGYLLPPMRGEDALVVQTNDPSALRRTPEDLPMRTSYRIEITGAFDTEGVLDAKVAFLTRGDLEVLIRLLSTRLPAGQFSQMFEAFAAKRENPAYGQVKFSDFKLNNPSDSSSALSAEVHFKGRLMYVNPDKSSGRDLSRSLSLAMLEKDGMFPLPPVPETKDDHSDAEMPQPIELGGPREYSLSVSVDVPAAKLDKEHKPFEVHAADEYAEYDSSAKWEGQTFHGNWRLNLLKAEIPATGVKEYAAFRKKVFEPLAEPVTPSAIVTAKASTTPGAPAAAESAASKVPASTAASPATKSAGLKTGDAPTSASQPSPIDVDAAYALFKQGEDEAKRNNWANAIHKYEEAVKVDPIYPDAWRELGRQRMNERDYPEAEAAFRKYLELAPDNRLAYLNMAWALYTEKKFPEDIEMLEKRIASAPEDGDAHTRLGAAYLATHQAARAIPELEKGTSILPRYEYAQYTLARAYLEAHEDAKAASAFERAVELDHSELTLNDAAYQLADRGISLDLAEGWAKRAVSAIEAELNGSGVTAAGLRTAGLVSRLGSYWDTLGWIKFQKHDLAAAEEYILAAWQLQDHPAIGAHLGRIYEAQGKKSEAVEAFAEALATVPATREASDDEKDARKRLAALLGSDPLVDDRVKEAKSRLRGRMSVSIPNVNGAEGFAQYSVIIGPGSKVVDLDIITPDNPLAGLTDAVRAAAMPQVLPGSALQKLPRFATLTCATAEKPCTFTLASASVASRVASVTSTPGDER